MSRLPPLTADQKALLREIEDGVGRAYLPDHLTLEKKGLLQIKTGRFGDYTQITEAGRQYLARMASSQIVGLSGAQVPAPGSKKSVSIHPRERQPGLATSTDPARGKGQLLRDAPARICRKGATQAVVVHTSTNTLPRPASAGVSAAKRGTSPTRPSGRARGASPRR